MRIVSFFFFSTVGQMKCREARRSEGRSGWRDGGGAKKEEKYKAVYIWSDVLLSGVRKTSTNLSSDTCQLLKLNSSSKCYGSLSLRCTTIVRLQSAWYNLHTELESSNQNTRMPCKWSKSKEMKASSNSWSHFSLVRNSLLTNYYLWLLSQTHNWLLINSL